MLEKQKKDLKALLMSPDCELLLHFVLREGRWAGWLMVDYLKRGEIKTLKELSDSKLASRKAAFYGFSFITLHTLTQLFELDGFWMGLFW
ncbi:hypothetical protein NPIL_221191 [Nephila pilipes]|uniref:Uncharacterized protein n=1 Tax=Nephila pilipes TaxID=299642 RepID=A0A8X6PSN7_NEPPI|nr:hypothetical protein NPIL_33371 [Nephila pilipes]GFT82315.1 hypothetical protein NPIL_582751 [Nephila pilipes]GFT87226.1 hypothetical protein NPIL_552201 [Nephila pilipes]GFU43942.1 hypothetical protein NPIL_221191 [Nephila pilipes]